MAEVVRVRDTQKEEEDLKRIEAEHKKKQLMEAKSQQLEAIYQKAAMLEEEKHQKLKQMEEGILAKQKSIEELNKKK